MSRRQPRRLMRFVIGSAAAALIAATAPALVGGAVANAAPAGAYVDEATSHQVSDQEYELHVYSPSMDRMIQLKLLAPKNTDVPSPVLYLLNGAGGGEDSANWSDQSDVDSFFADKQTYVVIPQEGAFSYYTDWNQPDPALAENLGNNGVNKWQTFLTEELPPLMNDFLNTNGKNGLAGISSSGSAVLDLAIQAPDLYSAVGAYSGCAMASDPIGSSFIRLVTAAGGADATNMWGPAGSPQWAQHDPYVNAAKLPRIPMFISSGSGLPGVHDRLDDPRINGNVGTLVGQGITGGVIEAATSGCTHMLQLRTDSLGMNNIHYDFPVGGTHSWGYWEDDLHQSWPMFQNALF